MSIEELNKVPEVDIDPKGVFKYILMKVYGHEVAGKEPCKMIVRGYKICPYHELQEYVVINQSPGPSTIDDQPKEYKWNQTNTKILIEYYAKYKDKVGTLQMKNNTALWKKISDDLQKMNIKVAANNCLNRWKVLERNYKKFVDNQNKTGRGRKHFEYENEMIEIFGNKKNVHPEILLSTETQDHIRIREEEINMSSLGTEEIEKETERENIKTPIRKQRVVKNKMTTLEKLRLDRKAYYDERLKIEKEKIEVMKKRNELIAERNEIEKGKK